MYAEVSLLAVFKELIPRPLRTPFQALAFGNASKKGAKSAYEQYTARLVLYTPISV